MFGNALASHNEVACADIAAGLSDEIGPRWLESFRARISCTRLSCGTLQARYAGTRPRASSWRVRAGMSEQPKLNDVRMLLQIHDELVFEAPELIAEEAQALIVERMEHAMDLRVPLVVDSSVSKDWFSGK